MVILRAERLKGRQRTDTPRAPAIMKNQFDCPIKSVLMLNILQRARTEHPTTFGYSGAAILLEGVFLGVSVAGRNGKS